MDASSRDYSAAKYAVLFFQRFIQASTGIPNHFCEEAMHDRDVSLSIFSIDLVCSGEMVLFCVGLHNQDTQ